MIDDANFSNSDDTAAVSDKEKVAVIKCIHYVQDEVDTAVALALKSINFEFKKNSTVLIKPNILMAKRPEYAVSTHPVMIEAVCKILKQNDCSIIIGESSGWNTTNGFELSGIRAAGEKYGAVILDFEKDKMIEHVINGVVLEKITLPKILDDIDYIVNMPKMKTHGFMKMTGAIKNLYGCIPGKTKMMLHAKANTEKLFGNMLIDLYGIIRPKIAINIMDAIVGMEGEGPGNGDPKNTGMIIASTDAVALDIVQSIIMGFSPLEIESTKAAIERFAFSGIDNIELKGNITNIEDISYNYKPPGGQKFFPRVVGMVKNMIFSNPIIIPEVDKKRCVKCGICAKLCPVECIKLDPYPTFDRSLCIRCYCCHEHCPHGAIYLKKSSK